MAKLTSPQISVTFTELGISAITRGDKGTVALIVRDGAGPGGAYPAGRVRGTEGTVAPGQVRRRYAGGDREGHAAARGDRRSVPGGGAVTAKTPSVR